MMPAFIPDSSNGTVNGMTFPMKITLLGIPTRIAIDLQMTVSEHQ